VFFPRKPKQKSVVNETRLITANGSTMKTYGIGHIETDFGLTNPKPIPIHVADMGQPILGVDFLKVNKLLVDLEGQCLIEKITGYKVKCENQNHNSVSPKLLKVHSTPLVSLSDLVLDDDEQDQECVKLLLSFPKLTETPDPNAELYHAVKHHIVTRDPQCSKDRIAFNLRRKLWLKQK